MHCNYMSNNPAMYHYHKKTHNPIPDNKMCDHGCESPAMFIGTGGKYTCQKNAHQCPAYIKNHSIRIKEQWSRPESIERKEKTKQSLIDRLHNPQTIEKMKTTKRKKTGLITPESQKEYRHYARAIRKRAQQWAKEQGYNIGQQTYHVDHKLSILDAWNANLPEHIVNHPANLQIIEAKQNSSKGAKSLITVEELLKLISHEYS